MAGIAFGPAERTDTHMEGGAAAGETDELVAYDIPFNASHNWQPDRQLAPYMLANGATAAPTYAALTSLLAESPATVVVETCARRPFYMISKIALQPPTTTTPAPPSRKQRKGTPAVAQAASGTPKRKCKHGSACPHKATCKFDHSTPAAASGSARPRQKPQASGARGGNGSAPPRTASPAPKGWGPNC